MPQGQRKCILSSAARSALLQNWGSWQLSTRKVSPFSQRHTLRYILMPVNKHNLIEPPTSDTLHARGPRTKAQSR